MPLPLLAIGAAALKVGGAISKSPIWKGAMKGAVKMAGLSKNKAVRAGAAVAGTAAAWQGGTMAAQRAFGSPPGTGLPALPQNFAMPGMPGPGFSQAAAYNSLPVPSTGAELAQGMPQSLALNHPWMRTYYRAPKGYVIIRDPVTRQPLMALNKAQAKAMHLWKPKPKPPISVGDWHAYQAAKRVEKRLMKIARKGMRRTKTVYVPASRRK